MRYRVELVNRPAVIIEAQEFSSRENGVIFYSMRHLPREDRNDQWGNPLMRRMQVPVAYFSNVESIMEIPEGVDQVVPQMTEEAVPFNMGGNWITEARVGTQPQAWFDEATDVPEPVAVPIGLTAPWNRGAYTQYADVPEPNVLVGRGVNPIPVGNGREDEFDPDGINWDAAREE